MIFGLYTKKELENELARREHEAYIRRQMQEDIDNLRNHIAKLDCDVFELKVKVDPPEKPNCGSCGG